MILWDFRWFWTENVISVWSGCSFYALLMLSLFLLYNHFLDITISCMLGTWSGYLVHLPSLIVQTFIHSWIQSWNLTVRCTLWGFFQMLGLLLVFLKECPFQHAQSFHALSQLPKLKLFYIACFDTSFRYHFSFSSFLRKFESLFNLKSKFMWKCGQWNFICLLAGIWLLIFLWYWSYRSICFVEPVFHQEATYSFDLMVFGIYFALSSVCFLPKGMVQTVGLFLKAACNEHEKPLFVKLIVPSHSL